MDRSYSTVSKSAPFSGVQSEADFPAPGQGRRRTAPWAWGSGFGLLGPGCDPSSLAESWRTVFFVWGGGRQKINTGSCHDVLRAEIMYPEKTQSLGYIKYFKNGSY